MELRQKAATTNGTITLLGYEDNLKENVNF